jgi:hypothetical protein
VATGPTFDELSFGHLPSEVEAIRMCCLSKGTVMLSMEQVFTGVDSGELLRALAGSIKYNPGALDYFKSLPKKAPEFPPHPEFSVAGKDVPLKLDFFYRALQERLLDKREGGHNWAVIAEMGDTV